MGSCGAEKHSLDEKDVWRDGLARVSEVIQEVQDGIPDPLASLFQALAIREASRDGGHLGEDHILCLAIDDGIPFDLIHKPIRV